MVIIVEKSKEDVESSEEREFTIKRDYGSISDSYYLD